MDLKSQWPVLDEICRCVDRLSGLQVWAFGSMLRSGTPNDLDVLIVYIDRADVVALREMGMWEVNFPPVDMIAMTPDEEHYYQFVRMTGAIRLYPPA